MTGDGVGGRRGPLECKGGNETPALLLLVDCFPSREFQLPDSRALVIMESGEESVGHSIGEACFSHFGAIILASVGAEVGMEIFCSSSEAPLY